MNERKKKWKTTEKKCGAATKTSDQMGDFLEFRTQAMKSKSQHITLFHSFSLRTKLRGHILYSKEINKKTRYIKWWFLWCRFSYVLRVIIHNFISFILFKFQIFFFVSMHIFCGVHPFFRYTKQWRIKAKLFNVGHFVVKFMRIVLFLILKASSNS